MLRCAIQIPALDLVNCVVCLLSLDGLYHDICQHRTAAADVVYYHEHTVCGRTAISVRTAAHVCVLQVAEAITCSPAKVQVTAPSDAACVRVVAYTHRTLSAALSIAGGTAALEF
jgi:hypothetical protein